MTEIIIYVNVHVHSIPFHMILSYDLFTWLFYNKKKSLILLLKNYFKRSRNTMNNIIYRIKLSLKEGEFSLQLSAI